MKNEDKKKLIEQMANVKDECNPYFWLNSNNNNNTIININDIFFENVI
jgi:ABC-type Zn uptake system ZnuABC Zn-binding protein ZnuA